MTVEEVAGSEAGRKVYEAIVNGPRGSASPFPLRDDSGELVGPFGLMVRFPALGGPLQELGTAVRYSTSLSARGREIAILTVARLCQSSFEAYAHTLVARHSGLSEAEILALLSGDFHSHAANEQAICQLSEDLLLQNSLERTEFGLDDETVAEVVTLVGYYRLLSQLMTQFDVIAPNVENSAPPTKF